jgi:hypothetical protein
MTAKVEIGIEAQFDDARRELAKLSDSVDELGDANQKAGLSLTDLKSGIDMASSAMQKIGEAYAATIGKTVAYAEQVRDLSRLSGASAEKTSELIQVSDDLKVEYGTLEQAAKALAKDGIALTTEELAKSSDEYLAIEDAGGRAEYAVKKFGRAGLELTKVLETSGEELRAMGAAQSSHLILTQEQLDKTRELEKAQDELEDSIAGLTYQFSMQLIPQINQTIQMLNTLGKVDSKTWFKDAAFAVANFVLQVGYGQKSIEEFGGKALKAAMPMEEYKKLSDEIAKSASFVKKETNLSTTAIDGWATSLENSFESIEEHQRYLAAEKTLMDEAKTATGLTGDAVNGLAQKYGSLTQAIIYNTLAAGMDKDAAIALGVSMGIITPQVMAARDAVDYLAASTSAAMKQTQAYVGQAEALAAAIAKLQDKSITITTYFNNVGQRSDNLVDPNGPGGPGSNPGQRPMTEAQLQAYQAEQRRLQAEEDFRNARLKGLQ